MTVDPRQRAELSRLYLAVSSGDATDDELAALNALLRDNDDAQRLLVESAQLQAALMWNESERQLLPFEAPSIQAPKTRFTPLGGLSIGNVVSTAAAACLVLALGVVMYRAAVDAPRNVVNLPVTVATLRSADDCVWGGRRTRLEIGDKLQSGEKLELKSGVAKLGFLSDVAVVVESPAVFELATATSMRLEQGTVAVRVNGPKKDFVVIAPNASIVDLGTSFGVHATPDGLTDVEVFEGAVEIHAGQREHDNRVLGMGGSARVQGTRGASRVDFAGLQEDRFGELLAVLWDDMNNGAQQQADDGDTSVVVANFADAPIPGTIDTFYGATRGRGWVTPWVASGNPQAEIRRDARFSGDADDPYLLARFFMSYERTIAREYGARENFNPRKPHIISWKWRFDGDLADFGDTYADRIHFYGNPYFRRNSWPTNSWLIGVVGGNERGGLRRRVVSRRWYVFDGRPGDGGDSLERENMIDTGLELKPGVVYQFAVVVYPENGHYDVAIRDGERTYLKSGLAFRNGSAAPANVVHFGVCTDNEEDDLSFSLDDVRIRQFTDQTLSEDLLSSGAENFGEAP